MSRHLFKDYYAVLGVDRRADQTEIKAAFRKGVQQYHPDKTGGYDETFKELSEANETLSDPVMRAAYDEQYDRMADARDGVPPPPPPDPPKPRWDPEKKPCPFCGEQIMLSAVVCRFCLMDLRSGRSTTAPTPEPPRVQDPRTEYEIMQERMQTEPWPKPAPDRMGKPIVVQDKPPERRLSGRAKRVLTLIVLLAILAYLLACLLALAGNRQYIAEVREVSPAFADWLQNTRGAIDKAIGYAPSPDEGLVMPNEMMERNRSIIEAGDEMISFVTMFWAPLLIVFCIGVWVLAGLYKGNTRPLRIVGGILLLITVIGIPLYLMALGRAQDRR